MIAAAKKSGKKLMIAHNQRFVPSHQKARQLIQSGEIGKIYSFPHSIWAWRPRGMECRRQRRLVFSKGKSLRWRDGRLRCP